jgi:uncharacterized protein involved in exopolysaccharide biosynthesis
VEKTQANDQSEFTLFDIIKPLITHKKLFASIIIFFIIISIIYILFANKFYRSKAVLMPINSGGSGGSLIAQQIPINLGLGSNEGLTEILTLLDSDSLAFKVLEKERNHIIKGLYPEKWNSEENKWLIDTPPSDLGIIKKLKKGLSIEDDFKRKTVELEITSRDAESSSIIVETYIKELRKYINSNDLTISQKNKSFLEDQLLRYEETFLKKSKAISNFPLQYDVRDSNPLMNITLESDSHEKKIKLDGISSDLYLEFLTLRREGFRTIYSLLEQQYQMAKIEAEKSKFAFHVIDPPYIAPTHSWPNNFIILFLGTFAGLLSGILIVNILEFFKLQKDSFK